ncbi:hypothetical protein E4U52_007412 [Claviceps spartinae]|nr:hypothetical protein E4U52_007412 [Claviceps spartinae]KAG6076388.1 hypothetical protein E4U15_005155 [Claviceps sp. LM218 group G6]KAG6097992.1 hypothetical protein E4U30_000118 [Claviceps sp. LM220 group G6]KAG6104351.1 hypothetical protein E4U14_005758 [Claviceps sp. LM454 group G7]KAG6107007.1 hypothetical protein E4U31_000365 [Claviceps sp. LM219 group G6]
MKFSAAVSSIFLAGSAVAVPTTVQTDKPQTFDVVAVKPSSPIEDFVVGAASRGLLLDLANQNATCEGENDQATFYIEGSKLFLYSDDKPQQIFVDRSGMGQGITGYVDEGSSFPRNGELEGWAINASGDLTFAGNNFLACPGSIEGAWRIWADAGVLQPGGSQGCVSFVAHTLPNDEPVSCHYS